MSRNGARSFGLLASLGILLTLNTGCELVVDALQDGLADFLETTTANLLEQAFPVPMPSGEGGGG